MANEIMSADYNVSSNAFGSNTQIHQGDTTVIHNYSSNASRKAHFMLPFPPNENIVCRPEIVAKVDKLLARSKGGHYCGAALWGLGGSGKTQIALDYAYRRSHEDPACDIFWVHADNKTSFTRDYQRIARHLDLDYKVNGEELFVTVCHRIRSLQRWLLILDNADDLALFGIGVGGQIKSLFEYIPHGPGGTVLWTSRDEQIVSLVGSLRGVQISHMRIEEAESLLAMTKRDDIGADEIQEAKLLLQELQWLPLAISQAGSYMRRTSTPIKKYLSKLLEGKSRWDMLKQSQHDRHRRPNVSNSVLETWNISISHIRKESDITYKVLHTIAYLDTEKIPLSFILAASNDNKLEQETPSHSEEEVLKMIIPRLKDFSFISERKEENCDEPSFDMHKLVQYAIRYQLKTDDFTLETYFATAALRVVTSLFPKEITIETMRLCDKYATHAIRVSCWADLSENVTTTSSFLTDLTKYFVYCGAKRKGEYMAKRAFDLLNNNTGETHPLNMIGVLHNVIYMNINQERWEEAERMTLGTVAGLEQVFGENNIFAIATSGILVSIYRYQGRYKEAEELQIKLLHYRQKHYGWEEKWTIDAMAELASIYKDQKRYDEAKKLKIKTLALYSEVLGERHPKTFQAMGSLAETYILAGNSKEAEELDLKLLSLGQEFPWEEYPRGLDFETLVITFSALRLTSKTRSIQKRILSLLQKSLGDRNRFTICAMASLAVSYLYEEDSELRSKGVELSLKAVALMREGDRHSQKKVCQPVQALQTAGNAVT
ncbi:NB-ARC domain-containing protein [Trichoderma simmonsii]|uniref:NB-ARC domain-containing protein n=1 Tax=Trichoderma simmonsii TaxID=1491479 RepID=A0A8G0LK15_9HYPO|nr:NB-ARC domain-containing protein [Trichoderma simmonsii]